jgi:hypothetical protein
VFCVDWDIKFIQYNSLCLFSKSACVPIHVIHLRTWRLLLICYSCWQAHAASAILNFSENCTPEILTPYLDGIVNKLLVLLQVCIYLCWIRFQLASNNLLSWLVNMLTAHVHILEWQANGAGGSIDSSSISSRFITGNCSHGSFMLLYGSMLSCIIGLSIVVVVVLSSLLIVTTS